MGLTDGELLLCGRMADLYNAFAALPVCHPSERADFVFYLHAMQSIIMARAAQRDHADIFRQPEAGE